MNALTLLLADDGWHHGSHWWIVFPILWLLLAATVLMLFLRRGRGACHDSPKRILGERFARGEISVDEYRDRLSQLQ
ncbi:MAG TPA: hypothetical protein VHC67_18770 [Gaiellaceae bacterium]|nr:hypothetical protein [Gaiellaceae bacterium]